MDAFGRRGSLDLNQRCLCARAADNRAPDSFAAPKPSEYDFLNQKYENKNPSKILINIASQPVLIEKKTRNPFFRLPGFFGRFTARFCSQKPLVSSVRGPKLARRPEPHALGSASSETNDGAIRRSPRTCPQPGRRLSKLRVAILLVLFSIFGVRPAAAQTTVSPGLRDDLWTDLQEFVDTPSVSGYENQLSEKIRAKLAAFHPVVDNLGDVIVTIGSGAPHRLIVTPIDEPGFVVSEITADGYLRLQRLPQNGLPPIFNELYSAQPVKVRTASGKWIDGVVAGISVHLHRSNETLPSASDIENMYVDIGANSAAEARRAGVDILSPVAVNRQLADLAEREFSGASIGDKIGAVVLVSLVSHLDLTNLKGSLTVAFVAQQRVGGRGLDRILRTTQSDEMIYVGRMLPGGNVPGMQGVHRA